MISAAELIRLTERDDQGLAWSMGMRYSLVSGHCTAPMVLEAVDRAAGYFDRNVAKGQRGDATLAWRSMSTAMTTTAIDATREPLQLTTEMTALTHITTLEVMAIYHFPVISEVLSGTTAVHSDSSTRLQIIEEAVTKLDELGRLKPGDGARLGQERLWVSAHDEWDKARDARLASQVRDFRGLIHLGVGEFLVGYRFGPDADQILVRPTALDHVGRRYRSWSNSSRHEPMGTAVDLQRFAAEDEDMDGASECLVAGFHLDEDRLNAVVMLGHPTDIDSRRYRGEAETGVDGDRAFAVRLQRELNALMPQCPTLLQLLGLDP